MESSNFAYLPVRLGYESEYPLKLNLNPMGLLLQKKGQIIELLEVFDFLNHFSQNFRKP